MPSFWKTTKAATATLTAAQKNAQSKGRKLIWLNVGLTVVLTGLKVVMSNNANRKAGFEGETLHALNVQNGLDKVLGSFIWLGTTVASMMTSEKMMPNQSATIRGLLSLNVGNIVDAVTRPWISAWGARLVLGNEFAKNKAVLQREAKATTLAAAAAIPVSGFPPGAAGRHPMNAPMPIPPGFGYAPRYPLQQAMPYRLPLWTRVG